MTMFLTSPWMMNPFPVKYHTPSTITPVVGAQTAKVNMVYYEKFLMELDRVKAHVHETYVAPLANVVPKRTRFSSDQVPKPINVEASKRFKLNYNKKASLALFQTNQIGNPSVRTMLPEFRSVTPLGDLPGVENYTGYGFGGNLATEGK